MQPKIFYLLLCLLVFYSACKVNKEKEEASAKEGGDITHKLELVWQTDTLLSTCESVLYDKNKAIIYVANINNGPWEKDGNGFISIIDTEGKLVDHKWVTGLSGPKGMGLFGNKLYVNDIDEIVEIDVDEAKIINKYGVGGDPALNDISISPDGIVYVTGSTSNSIYALKEGKVDTIVTADFGRLNGILHRPEGLYFAASNSHRFGLYHPEADSLEILAEGIGHGDGIVQVSDREFVVSSWKGEIFHINTDERKKQLLLSPGKDSLNAADIDFIPESKLILVPTFFGNKVMAYKLTQEKTKN